MYPSKRTSIRFNTICNLYLSLIQSVQCTMYTAMQWPVDLSYGLRVVKYRISIANIFIIV